MSDPNTVGYQAAGNHIGPVQLDARDYRWQEIIDAALAIRYFDHKDFKVGKSTVLRILGPSNDVVLLPALD